MPSFGGLSFSKVGLQKNLLGGTPSSINNLKFNVNNLLKDKIKNFISTKAKLIDYNFYQSLGFDANLVGYDLTLNQLDMVDKPMSPRMMNWVEPYEISGVRKTLFYTEINSDLKVGDRVFIINGNYDSDSLIKSDKYKKGRDGYKVLFVDKCRIVLDIDYTGVLPWLEDDIDTFIKLHVVENQSDFDIVNRQLTTRGGVFDYKFNFYQNNFIYSPTSYNPTFNYGPEWGVNSGITQSGFYVRDDKNETVFGTYSWYNITTPFTSGSFSYALSPTYSNNMRLKVLGGSFTLPVLLWDFKEGFIYKWEVGPTQSLWVVDVRYSRSILSKTNFRGGNFDGVWNTGLFGVQDKKINWSGEVSTWNTGTLLNAKWLKGSLNSKYTLSESYFTEYDEYGLPFQKINGPNNNDKGFNFIIDSEIESSTIQNGSIYNTNIGYNLATYSVIEQKILSGEINYSNKIKKAYFENCNFNNSKVENSELRNIRSVNTEFNNIKSINSYYNQSVIRNSDYISDDIIKILKYDELNISEHRTIDPLSTSATFSQRNGVSHKLYKFYISKRDYERFKKGDYFYLKNITINDGKKQLLNFFDKKFKLGTWFEYFDDFYDPSNPNYTATPQMGISSTVGTYSFFKRGVSMTAYLSTPKENEYYFTTITDGLNYWTDICGLNPNNNYSIDLFVSSYDRDDNFIEGLDFDRQSTPFMLYGDDAIKFTYLYGNQFTEIRQPSGYYDGKPWYVLTTGGATFGYIFYTASNSRWEYHQNFDSITGIVSGDFCMSLGETGSLPLSTTQSWVQESSSTVTIESSLLYDSNPNLPTLLSKINIDPKPGIKAYVIDSDFSSGVFERSNWSSGQIINYNNDLNITKFSNKGGEYDLQIVTSSSTLIANTSLSNFYKESSDDTLKVGNIIFLNGVDYDTRGQITSISINNPGDGYSTGTNLQLIGGSGTQATVDITASVIGGVVTVSSPTTPHNYGSDGVYTGVSTTPVSTSGTGLTIDIVVSGGGGLISSVSINNPGSGYVVNDVVSIDGYLSLPDAQLTILSITNGEILSATISTGGIQYLTNELLSVDLGNNGLIEVTSTTGSVVTLGDSYKISSVSNNQITLQEVATSSIISNLLPNGITKTNSLSNRWGYIHTQKITKSFIKSGLMKRVYLKDNLIQNKEINLDDKDFNDILNFKKLTISESLFRNNKNILSKASYVNSNLASGSDVWNNGLFLNSVWMSGTFSQGLIKESSWYSGKFNSGTFYQSKSFNANPNINSQFYDTDRIYSSWKSGFTSDVVYNDRYSWRGGTFSSGDFVKSDWESGNFLNGRFFNSKWYSGTFSKGNIGDISLTSTDTWFYNGDIKTAVVENATLYAIDTSFNGLSSSNINWEIGTFNDGIFGSSLTQSTPNSATWNDGIFNGGEFRTNGKWKTGVFNGGKFISGFGWTYATTNQSDYGWEDGEFNGGEFGNANLGTNSIWYTGEFNGGKFVGRYWNDGVFSSGDFIGSSTYSAVGGGNPDGMTSSNADSFVDSFIQSYYGIWGGGLVTNNKDEFIKNKKIFTKIERTINPIKPFNVVNFKNMVWKGGTFSHHGGKFYNSVWLDGNFFKGKFDSSSFNPFVKRNSVTRSFNLNDDLIQGSGSCLWQDGVFENSEFYISQWKTGKFISGTAFGMVWRNGTANYMNAYNVFWDDGVWRNGNWNGSYIKFDGSVTSDFNRQILFRGMSYSGTSSTHFWNVFEELQTNLSIDTSLPSGPTTSHRRVFTPIFTLSDITKKTNIHLIDTVNGINIYRYEYIDLPGEVYEGVIAQDLLSTEYENAVIDQDGLLYVDYSKLNIEFKKIS